MTKKATSAPTSQWRRASENSTQSRIRTPSSRQKMSSACRSPWPSHTRPNAIRSLNRASRPIAGSRPRGRSEQEDELAAGQLLEDPKELAEHVMLVDLARNDVGRVVGFGTEKVDEFMTVRRYSHRMP